MPEEFDNLPPLIDIETHWIRTPQAAEIIGMSMAAVVYACNAKTLRAYKLGGEWRIDPLSAQQYIRRKPTP